MAAGVAAALDPIADAELGPAPVADAGADPHVVLLPNASPATTQGVVSELIWILLPGGWVMAIVAFEDDEAAAGTADGVADGVVVAPVELVPPLVAELTPDGAVEEAALGVVAVAAGLALDELGAEEPARLVGDVELAGTPDAATGGVSPEKAVATSEEDR